MFCDFMLRSDELKAIFYNVFAGISHNTKDNSRNQISSKMIGLSPIRRLNDESGALWVLFLKSKANFKQMNN